MALTYAETDSGHQTGDITLAHTLVSGGQYLYTVVANDYYTNGPVSGITYAGTGMSEIGRVQNTTGVVEVMIYRLASPASGSNDVVVSVGGSGGWIRAWAISFAGINTTTPNGTVQGQSAYTSTPSVNVASASDDLVIGASMIWDASPSGSGLDYQDGTAIWELVGWDPLYGEDTYAAGREVAAGTTTTFDFSNSSSNGQAATIGVAIKPGAAAPASLLVARQELRQPLLTR